MDVWTAGVDPQLTEFLAAVFTLLAIGYVSWYIWDIIKRDWEL